MLQEYIPGPPTCHYMVEGCLVSVPLDRIRGAIESLDRLFAHLSYRGVFEAEFKYDDRDGQLKLLEVNTRPWYFMGFAAHSIDDPRTTTRRLVPARACQFRSAMPNGHRRKVIIVKESPSYARGRRLAKSLGARSPCSQAHGGVHV